MRVSSTARAVRRGATALAVVTVTVASMSSVAAAAVQQASTVEDLNTAVSEVEAPVSAANDGVSVPTDASAPLKIDAPAGDLTLSAPAVGPGTRVGHTTLFEGALPATTIGLQSTTMGARALVRIESPQAATAYRFDIGGDVRRLASQPDGTVLAYGPTDEVIGWIQAPWARDADGRSVPTRFVVHGNEITQIVDHQGGDFAYPVVADPALAPGCVTFRGPDFWGKVVVTNRCRAAYRLKAVRRAMVDTTCRYVRRGASWSFRTVAGIDRIERC